MFQLPLSRKSRKCWQKELLPNNQQVNGIDEEIAILNTMKPEVPHTERLEIMKS